MSSGWNKLYKRSLCQLSSQEVEESILLSLPPQLASPVSLMSEKQCSNREYLHYALLMTYQYQWLCLDCVSILWGLGNGREFIGAQKCRLHSKGGRVGIVGIAKLWASKRKCATSNESIVCRLAVCRFLSSRHFCLSLGHAMRPCWMWRLCAPQCEASKKRILFSCNFEKQTPSLPFLFLGILQSRLLFILELRELKKKHETARKSMEGFIDFDLLSALARSWEWWMLPSMIALSNSFSKGYSDIVVYVWKRVQISDPQKVHLLSMINRVELCRLSPELTIQNKSGQ